MPTQDPRTRAARLLLQQFTDESASFNAIATDPDDMNSYTRAGARARRDAIDWAIAQLRVALPAIEDEAVDIEVSETARMQAALDAFEAEPMQVWS